MRWVWWVVLAFGGLGTAAGALRGRVAWRAVALLVVSLVALGMAHHGVSGSSRGFAGG